MADETNKANTDADSKATADATDVKATAGKTAQKTTAQKPKTQKTTAQKPKTQKTTGARRATKASASSSAKSATTQTSGKRQATRSQAAQTTSTKSARTKAAEKRATSGSEQDVIPSGEATAHGQSSAGATDSASETNTASATAGDSAPGAAPHSNDAEALADLKNRDWPGMLARLVFMILFGVLGYFALFVALFLTAVQFIVTLLKATPHDGLGRLIAGLGGYVGDVMAYLGFASDHKPFPLGRPFPDGRDDAD